MNKTAPLWYVHTLTGVIVLLLIGCLVLAFIMSQQYSMLTQRDIEHSSKDAELYDHALALEAENGRLKLEIEAAEARLHDQHDVLAGTIRSEAKLRGEVIHSVSRTVQANHRALVRDLDATNDHVQSSTTRLSSLEHTVDSGLSEAIEKHLDREIPVFVEKAHDEFKKVGYKNLRVREITLVDNTGQTRVLISSGREGSRIRFYDSKQNRRIELGCNSRTAGLFINDTNERKAATVQSTNGMSFISAYDRFEYPRVQMGVTKENVSYNLLLNSDDKPIYVVAGDDSSYAHSKISKSPGKKAWDIVAGVLTIRSIFR